MTIDIKKLCKRKLKKNIKIYIKKQLSNSPSNHT